MVAGIVIYYAEKASNIAVLIVYAEEQAWVYFGIFLFLLVYEYIYRIIEAIMDPTTDNACKLVIMEMLQMGYIYRSCQSLSKPPNKTFNYYCYKQSFRESSRCLLVIIHSIAYWKMNHLYLFISMGCSMLNVFARNNNYTQYKIIKF